MLTVLLSTTSNSQVFLLKKNVSSFCKCYSRIFSKNIGVYAIFNDQSFNDTLTNDIVSFEQLGPGRKDVKTIQVRLYSCKTKMFVASCKHSIFFHHTCSD